MIYYRYISFYWPRRYTQFRLRSADAAADADADMERAI